METDEINEDAHDQDLEEENDQEGFCISAEPLKNSATCLAPIEAESKIIINNTKKTIIPEDCPTMKIAPGEGKVPVNFLRDKHFEGKAYPRHFPTGQYDIHHERDIKLNHTMYFNQRVNNADPRFCKDPSYIFMAQAFLERENLEKQMNIAGRKGKIQNPNSSAKKVHLNDPFNCFQNIRVLSMKFKG